VNVAESRTGTPAIARFVPPLRSRPRGSVTVAVRMTERRSTR
jgi:hypothetical protein